MFKEMDAGKYISLQNSRFFSGCCYYHNRPERNLVVEAPVKVVPVHNNNRPAGSEYAFLDNVHRKNQQETQRWQRRQCRNNNYCNGHYVRRHHHNRQNNYIRQYRQNNRQQNNRQQNNKDLNWDVYGNSNGQWSILMEKEW
jgi:hypothetical protein